MLTVQQLSLLLIFKLQLQNANDYPSHGLKIHILKAFQCGFVFWFLHCI